MSYLIKKQTVLVFPACKTRALNIKTDKFKVKRLKNMLALILKTDLTILTWNSEGCRVNKHNQGKIKAFHNGKRVNFSRTHHKISMFIRLMKKHSKTWSVMIGSQHNLMPPLYSHKESIILGTGRAGKLTNCTACKELSTASMHWLRVNVS